MKMYVDCMQEIPGQQILIVLHVNYIIITSIKIAPFIRDHCYGTNCMLILESVMA